MSGGDYKIDSTVKPADSSGCVFGSFLRGADGIYGEIAATKGDLALRPDAAAVRVGGASPGRVAARFVRRLA